jgi:hypothetical protein
VWNQNYLVNNQQTYQHQSAVAIPGLYCFARSSTFVTVSVPFVDTSLIDLPVLNAMRSLPLGGDHAVFFQFEPWRTCF